MRASFAALVLGVLVLVNQPSSLSEKFLKPGFVVGVLGFGLLGCGLNQWTYFLATQQLPVGVAILIEYLSPLFLMLWLFFVEKEKIQQLEWLLFALIFMGSSLLLLSQNTTSQSGISVFGVMIALISAVSFAFWSRGGQWLTDRMSVITSFFVVNLLIACVSFPFVVKSLVLEKSWSGETSLQVFFMVSLGYLVPFSLYLFVIKKIGPLRSNFLALLEPFMAAFFAYFLMGETLSVFQLIGGIVVLTGLMILLKFEKTEK